MKTCPKCGELIGDSVNECFKCHYNYSYGRVITPQEIANERKRAEKEIQDDLDRKKSLEEMKQDQIKRNPLYEYKIETVTDYSTGEINDAEVQKILLQYSSEGWRLHSIFTNEIGKSSSTTSLSFLGVGVNATIDQTVLIFERCIKPLEK